MKNKTITAIGYDLSPTDLTVAGRTSDREEAFVSLPRRGATTWKAHCLPGLFAEALKAIKAQGFEFAQGGVISGSVRQHDMVLLDAQGRLLMPALSWQCNAATEVELLKVLGAEAIVGRLEPRLVLPKLLLALNQEPDLENDIVTVMTIGDFIAMELTGAQTLCSSEAVSNGLLIQNTRQFAREFIESLPGLKSSWFPPVVKSGEVISWNPNSDFRSPDWEPIRNLLPGWRVVAGLGHNHAGAVGSGLIDRHTVVISAGTSGTVTRAVKFGTTVDRTVMQFEYYEDTLLFSKMTECASWYERFKAEFASGRSHLELNSLALPADNRVYGHPYPATANARFEPWFYGLPLELQVRTMQYSIAYFLTEHLQKILTALDIVGTDDQHFIQRVVLTGGLTGSQYFYQMLKDEIRSLDFEGEILVSNRVGHLASQTATLGALINALVGGGLYPNLEAAINELCPARAI